MKTEIEKGVKELKALLVEHNNRYGSSGYDFEAIHVDADKIILEYLPDEIKKAYLEVEKECGGFVHA